MKCPRDGSTLVNEKYEDTVTVDRCPTCSGIWLDAGELKSIQEISERDYTLELGRVDTVFEAYEMARQEMQRDISCPKCSEPLESREYAYCSQIMVDRCTHCAGVWLDQGELAALERFFETAQKEQRDLEREAEQGNVLMGFFASLWNKIS